MGGLIWWNISIIEDVEKKAIKKRKFVELEAEEDLDVVKCIVVLK